MTSRDAWLILQLVIGLGTELYTARAVVRRYQLYYSCEVRSCTIWLYYLFYCRLVAMPTSQLCTLHCPCAEKKSWFVIVVCLCKYLVICHLCLLLHRSMVAVFQVCTPRPRACSDEGMRRSRTESTPPSKSTGSDLAT